ncbi:hypothetical protein PanWU01x14_150740 [Parasponia andersonii]|uniref:Uncharacterized protein n=1 Tax=Parasponia andersonii TaxID=3476 RepID=A0A2P5CHX9_PARAD|nr:hypothetical protein PanWU01x14_150740 [Parasponia andersonii]
MEDDDTTTTSNGVPILQKANFSTFQIWVELLELDNVRFQQDDVEPAEVNNIDKLLHESRVVRQDDFLVDDDEFEDDTLEEYDDEEIEIVDSDISSEENNNISDDEVVHLLDLGRVVMDPTPKERGSGKRREGL